MNDDQDEIRSLVAALKRKTAIDPVIPTATRKEAVAETLRSAGKAVSPLSANPRAILSALAALERLAGLPTETIARPWLAIRAIAPKAGEAIGGNDAADPVASVLVQSAGAVPTLELGEKVVGILGNPGNRPLNSEIRIIPRTFSPPFSVLDGEDAILSEPAGQASAENLLDGVDALPSRGKRAKVKANFAKIEIIEPETKELRGERLFEPYVPARLRFPGAPAHPHALVEAAALASVLPPIPSAISEIPAEFITGGKLSDVQLETLVAIIDANEERLLSDPSDPSAPAPRKGFLIGHGTGFGKGRVIAAAFLMEWLRGNRRALWVSERHRHAAAARRDWIAIGGERERFIDAADLKLSEPLPERDGVLFITYGQLAGENDEASVVERIVEWLGPLSDAVVALDEAQAMRSAVVAGQAGRERRPSKRGLAGLALQNSMPNSRVIYSSATAATDATSLGYAVRLGLWGRGTAFPTAEAFFRAIEEGGINAMEIVARDLKASGLLLSASLSFEGVAQERLERPLDVEERALQNALSRAWTEIDAGLRRALVSTGVSTLAADAGRALVKLHAVRFGMARARFFQALLASMKTPMVIDAIRMDLVRGFSSVIQLTNTFESNADRAIARQRDGNEAEIDASPRDILLDYVAERFPTQLFKTKRTARGLIAVPVLDAAGEPVHCPIAIREKEALAKLVAELPMPEGPLEQILAAFGPNLVAEVTGRSRRLIPDESTGGRRIENRGAGAADEDARLFAADEKPILVFSSSGATGGAYHATGNAKPRRHYLLQPGQRADAAIQGLGTTHRSGQGHPPTHILVATDLWADRRAASAVASGMQRLGAITRGQRQASGTMMFSENDDLESPIAERAWKLLLRDVETGRTAGISLASMEAETGIRLRRPGSERLAPDHPALRRFLNALAGMTCDGQEAFGSAFRSKLDELRIAAAKSGNDDGGTETILSESLVKLDEIVIHQDPRSGAATKLLTMLRRDVIERTSHADALRRSMKAKSSRFARSAITGRIACLARETGRNDDPKAIVAVISPNGTRRAIAADVDAEAWIPTGAAEAEALWNAELSLPPEEDETVFHVVSGALLPIWDRLPKGKAVACRMETDEGERILGRVVPSDWATAIIDRSITVAGNASVDPDSLLTSIENGNVVTLAGGTIVKTGTSDQTGRASIEIIVGNVEVGTPAQRAMTRGLIAELRSIGAVQTTKTRRGNAALTLSDDPSIRAATWRALIAAHPPVAATELPQ